MIDVLTWSNLINLAILFVTSLVGILAWLGARHSAREARQDQQRASEAALRSASAAEDATRLQGRMVELEEQRARDTAAESLQAALSAEYAREQQLNASGRPQNDFFVIIKNQGKAAAHNLRMDIEGVSADDHGQVMLSKPLSECTIGPGGELRMRLTLHLGGGLHTPFDVAIDWEDESEAPGHWEGTLS